MAAAVIVSPGGFPRGWMALARPSSLETTLSSARESSQVLKKVIDARTRQVECSTELLVCLEMQYRTTGVPGSGP
jgi:hypothetical protein